MIKLFLTTGFFLQIISSIETTILKHLTEKDQKSLILAKEIINILPS